MLNWSLLKSPVNWLVVWSMLLLGWFAFRTIQRSSIGGAVAAQTS